MYEQKEPSPATYFIAHNNNHDLVGRWLRPTGRVPDRELRFGGSAYRCLTTPAVHQVTERPHEAEWSHELIAGAAAYEVCFALACVLDWS